MAHITHIEVSSVKHGLAIPYATCSTAAATAAKVAALSNFTLATGAQVKIKFDNANTAANPTLNVNSTGAKSIKAYGTTGLTTSWAAGSVVDLTYDGTNWVVTNCGTYAAAVFNPDLTFGSSADTIDGNPIMQLNTAGSTGENYLHDFTLTEGYGLGEFKNRGYIDTISARDTSCIRLFDAEGTIDTISFGNECAIGDESDPHTGIVTSPNTTISLFENYANTADTSTGSSTGHIGTFTNHGQINEFNNGPFAIIQGGVNEGSIGNTQDGNFLYNAGNISIYNEPQGTMTVKTQTPDYEDTPNVVTIRDGAVRVEDGNHSIAVTNLEGGIIEAGLGGHVNVSSVAVPNVNAGTLSVTVANTSPVSGKTRIAATPTTNSSFSQKYYIAVQPNMSDNSNACDVAVAGEFVIGTDNDGIVFGDEDTGEVMRDTVSDTIHTNVTVNGKSGNTYYLPFDIAEDEAEFSQYLTITTDGSDNGIPMLDVLGKVDEWWALTDVYVPSGNYLDVSGSGQVTARSLSTLAVVGAMGARTLNINTAGVDTTSVLNMQICGSGSSAGFTNVNTISLGYADSANKGAAVAQLNNYAGSQLFDIFNQGRIETIRNCSSGIIGSASVPVSGSGVENNGVLSIGHTGLAGTTYANLTNRPLTLYPGDRTHVSKNYPLLKYGSLNLNCTAAEIPSASTILTAPAQLSLTAENIGFEEGDPQTFVEQAVPATASSTTPTAPTRGSYGWKSNNGDASSWSRCRLRFTTTADMIGIIVVTFSSSEANYDYGLLSKIDRALNSSTSVTETNAYVTLKGVNGYRCTFMPLNGLAAGSHYIEAKYIKDGSQNHGFDVFTVVGVFPVYCQ